MIKRPKSYESVLKEKKEMIFIPIECKHLLESFDLLETS